MMDESLAGSNFSRICVVRNIIRLCWYVGEVILVAEIVNLNLKLKSYRYKY